MINFSEQVTEFLQNNQTAVVKAMMGAGVQAASSISKAELERELNEASEKTLH